MGLITENIQIKNLGTIITGGTPPTKKREFYGDVLPLIKPTDMSLGQRYIGTTEESLSDLGVERFKNKLVPKNTPCVVTIGTIGKSCLTKETSLVNQAVNCVVVDSNKYDYMYVYYLMQLTIPKVKAKDSGTASGRENVSKSSFETIEVAPVKNINEQKKLGKVLSAYDELIENNNRRIAILEDMAQSLYREWFVKFRFPRHQNTKFKESSLGLIPEGWGIGKLGDLTSKIGSGATPRGGKGAYKTEGIPLIRSMNIYDSTFITKGLAFIDDDQALKLQNVTVQAKDVLLNITGASVARCAIVPTAFTPARVNQHVAIIRVGGSDISPEYILHTLISTVGKARLLNIAQGGATREAITKLHIENFEILIPPSGLHANFENLASNTSLEKEVLFLKNENLKKQRDMLLPKLITGKVKVD